MLLRRYAPFWSFSRERGLCYQVDMTPIEEFQVVSTFCAHGTSAGCWSGRSYGVMIFCYPYFAPFCSKPCSFSLLCMLFSSTMSASSVADIILKKMVIFWNSFVNGTFVKWAVKGNCRRGCPVTLIFIGRNFETFQAALSKGFIWCASAVGIFAPVSLTRTLTQLRSWLPKDCGGVCCVMSFGIEPVHFPVVRPGRWQEDTKIYCSCHVINALMYYWELANNTRVHWIIIHTESNVYSC